MLPREETKRATHRERDDAAVSCFDGRAFDGRAFESLVWIVDERLLECNWFCFYLPRVSRNLVRGVACSIVSMPWTQTTILPPLCAPLSLPLPILVRIQDCNHLAVSQFNNDKTFKRTLFDEQVVLDIVLCVVIS